jgi:hypothetical protein
MASYPASAPATNANRQQPEQQLLFAAVLGRSTAAGTTLLLLSFMADALGLLAPRVAHADLPALWSQPVKRYVLLADWPTGWAWLHQIGRGDVANLLGIAVLSACSGICVLSVVPHYLRTRDRAYVGLCVAELAVLAFAASGWLAAGR